MSPGEGPPITEVHLAAGSHPAYLKPFPLAALAPVSGRIPVRARGPCSASPVAPLAGIDGRANSRARPTLRPTFCDAVQRGRGRDERIDRTA